MAEIEQVAVVGCGVMGHGIAQVVATAGYEVVVREVDEAALAQGLGRIEAQLARAVAKGKSTQEEADAIRARLTGTTSYADLAGADLVIEAITEDLPAKLAMWRELDVIVKPEALFATNTSSLSTVGQAAVTSRPDRFAGIHFFNPAQVMTLIEVIRALTTSDETFAAVQAWPPRCPASCRSRRATTPGSSSTACSSPTCSTACAPTRRASARWPRSTRR
ncbi:3-hydroxyacyl-CoA dehydrogenase family protein [Baekduia soli]|uniref:3-hydroxyacyl-CoA dehydrogenase family protein n=1 Tax=Baekduia soli TaxID=496014 RepID=UPI001E5A04CA|nr:3-hydroxyacyl-CoA dehydrogenase NAD-binding domain-containing protein [Baekduia soli]